MKHLLLLASFVLLGFGKAYCQAQVPDWVWAKGAPSDSAGYGEGMSIATDKSNNVYITGFYQDTIAFGSFILTTTSMESAFLAKYDNSGNIKWAKSSVSSSRAYIQAWSVCTDLFGNVYVTGNFTDTVSFGSFTLINPANAGVFLVKYDSSGNVLWAKDAIGTLVNAGIGVSTDLLGNVYITGIFESSTIAFGSYNLVNAGGDDIFIVKYNSSGNVVWAKKAGGSSDDKGFSITTDALANVYITGYFRSPSLVFGSYALTNVGGYDIFLAKYDSSGHVLWAKSAGGTDLDWGSYVATDSSGNAYITGYYVSTSLRFGSDTIVNAGGYDAFLAKYDSSGNVRWVKNIGGTGTEQGYCVAVDKSYKVYVTGYFDTYTLFFDTIMLQQPTVHWDPIFLAEYDSSGHALWAKALGSGGDDQNAIAISPSGCIYLGGDFLQVNPFIIGNDSLVFSGIEEVFVAKLCYPDSEESVPEISPTKEFICYPNPFDDKLNISASPPTPLRGRGEEERLLLYDVTGRLLLRCSFTNSATINTAALARGIYFYEVSGKDGVGARGKAVKQ